MESRTNEALDVANSVGKVEGGSGSVSFDPRTRSNELYAHSDGSFEDDDAYTDVDGQMSIEALQQALEQMTVPPCPPALRSVLDETSLEKLVYWKLQALFEHFDEAPPSNVLRVVHEHVERPLFSLVLKKTRGNQSRAAHVLGCNRNTLHRKLKNLAIQPSDVRRAIRLENKRAFRSQIESLMDGH
jgi:DNA-binding protein Fis